MLHEHVGHYFDSDYWPERSFAATAMLALARQLPAPERADALRFAQAAADRGTWRRIIRGSHVDAQATATGALDLARALPDSPERERLVGTLAEKAIADSTDRPVRARLRNAGICGTRSRLFVVLLPHLPEPYLSAAAEEVVRMIVDRFADPLEDNLTATLAAYLPEHLVPAIEPAITEAPVPLLPARTAAASGTGGGTAAREHGLAVRDHRAGPAHRMPRGGRGDRRAVAASPAGHADTRPGSHGFPCQHCTKCTRRPCTGWPAWTVPSSSATYGT